LHFLISWLTNGLLFLSSSRGLSSRLLLGITTGVILGLPDHLSTSLVTTSTTCTSSASGSSFGSAFATSSTLGLLFASASFLRFCWRVFLHLFGRTTNFISLLGVSLRSHSFSCLSLELSLLASDGGSDLRVFFEHLVDLLVEVSGGTRLISLAGFGFFTSLVLHVFAELSLALFSLFTLLLVATLLSNTALLFAPFLLLLLASLGGLPLERLETLVLGFSSVLVELVLDTIFVEAVVDAHPNDGVFV
jgi:hypothetical protein